MNVRAFFIVIVGETEAGRSVEVGANWRKGGWRMIPHQVNRDADGPSVMRDLDRIGNFFSRP